MKHSIRERVVDPIRGQVVKISTINAELGSGITDKNGNEIFEGDRVIQPEKGNGTPMLVSFVSGTFAVNEEVALGEYQDGELEIIGHVDD
ncbi:MAG: hypothetical protein IKP64_03225 [Selenomonadaceae bacterium]|nr:hypothetical protein [Selenomonadaceae bacterium]